MGNDAVLALARALELTSLLQSPGATAGGRADELMAADGSNDAPIFDASSPTVEVPPPAAANPATPASIASRDPALQGAASLAEPTGPEVTIIISQPGGGQRRMIVIPEATPWLMEVLTGEGPADQRTTAGTRRTTGPLAATR